MTRINRTQLESCREWRKWYVAAEMVAMFRRSPTMHRDWVAGETAELFTARHPEYSTPAPAWGDVLISGDERFVGPASEWSHVFSAAHAAALAGELEIVGDAPTAEPHECFGGL